MSGLIQRQINKRRNGGMRGVSDGCQDRWVVDTEINGWKDRRMDGRRDGYWMKG
jgi:hypothetical protein